MSFAALDEVLQDVIDSDKHGHDVIPGGIAVIAVNAEGKEIYKGQAGTLTYDTPAPVWSCSKMVTPVILLQLVQAGIIKDLHAEVPKFKEGDLLDQVLTGYDDAGNPILKRVRRPTWHELANHTSGAAYTFESPLFARYRRENPAPSGSALDNIYANYKGPLIFEPGTAYVYSVGLGIASLLIEEISGHDLEYYLQKNICEPLGLKKTHFKWPKDMPLDFPKREVYGDVNSPWKPTPIAPFPGNLGDASLYTTAAEFSVFAGELLKLVSGLPSKLLKDLSLAKLLSKDNMTSEARQSLNNHIKNTWQYRAYYSDIKSDTFHFGMGLIVNNNDLTGTGRKAQSCLWGGMFGCLLCVDPQSGTALHTFLVLNDTFDPACRRTQDRVEKTFYECLNAQRGH